MKLPAETASELASFIDNFYADHLTLSLVEEALPFFSSSFILNMVLGAAPSIDEDALIFLKDQGDSLEFPEDFTKKDYEAFFETRKKDLLLAYTTLRRVLRKFPSGSMPSHDEAVDSSQNLEEVFLTASWNLALITQKTKNLDRDPEALRVYLSLVSNRGSVYPKTSLTEDLVSFVNSFDDVAEGVFQWLLQKKAFACIYSYAHTPRKYFIRLCEEVVIHGSSFYKEVVGAGGYWEFLGTVCQRAGDKKKVQRMMSSVSAGNEDNRQYLTHLLKCPRLSYKDFCRIFEHEEAFENLPSVEVGSRWSIQDWADFSRNKKIHPSLKNVIIDSLRLGFQDKMVKNHFLLQKAIKKNNFRNHRVETYDNFGKSIIFLKEIKEETPDPSHLRACLIDGLRLPSKLQKKQVQALKLLMNFTSKKLGDIQKDSPAYSKEWNDRVLEDLRKLRTQKEAVRASLRSQENPKQKLSGIF